MKHITHSEKQTYNLGKKLAKTLKGGEVLALIGELGAGKTVLIKGIAAGLGIKQIITSPTFVLMKVYALLRTKNKKQLTINNLVHIDCYRIKNAEEISAIGAQEYFSQKNTVVVVEWADKIKPILPRLRSSSFGGQARQKKEIKIKLIDQNTREITIKSILSCLI